MKQGVYLRELKAEATDATIDIVGIIGWEVAYLQLRDMLRAIPTHVNKVTFEIFSPGGDVWEGNGIVQEIGELSKRANTVANVQVAASMATLIAVACKERTISRNGRFLIHNAWTQTTGDAAEHEKAAQTLRDAEQEAAQFYAERTGKSAEEMLALMDEERWLMPEEALALGFVQTICDPFKVEEFAGVREEIEAAGKWPQALAVMPPAEEETTDALPVTDGATEPTPVAEPDAGTAADDAAVIAAAEEAGFARGLADGEAIGRQSALAEFGAQIEELKHALTTAQAEARKNQSEKDKLTAQLAAAHKASDERAAGLRRELDEAAVKLRQFVSGALAFSAAIETWPEAMSACGGDYAKAAATYPELLKTYIAVERQKERSR